MRIVIATDAWYPQVNGVVRTLDMARHELAAAGHEVHMLTPERFASVPCPTYPEIRLALAGSRRVGRIIDAIHPDAVHIATEGPLGLAARRHCVRSGAHFTTSFHTRFPEYVHARVRLPLSVSYRWLRWFHGASRCVMVATATLEADLRARGFVRLRQWTRGVNTTLFDPARAPALALPRPVHLYVGRVAVEKNLRAFLDLELAGSKIVVGDGPQLASLKRAFAGVHFAGAKQGTELAAYYTAADVFVFPSLTDTFGLVMLEALASGVPVAAFPVPGPSDVLADRACAAGAPRADAVGCLDADLAAAARTAGALSPRACRDFALDRSWARSAEQFLRNLVLRYPLPDRERPETGSGAPRQRHGAGGRRLSSPAGGKAGARAGSAPRGPLDGRR